MELRQLQYLTVCAETKSFTKAANVLYTAQSNVSKVIRSLEEELGFELFERRQYGIALTPAGRQVYEQALVTLGNARQILDYAHTGQRQELRICMNPDSWMERSFAEYYKDFQREDVHYCVMTAETGQVIERLSRGIDQIGFIYIMEQQLPRLQSRLEREHLYCTMLARTKLMLDIGNGPAAMQKGLDLPPLVQEFEDAFSLHSYRSRQQAQRPDRRQDHKEHKEEPVQRVAVTTNSENLRRTLLEETQLGHMTVGRMEPISSKDDTQAAADAAVEGDTEAQTVLFGYISRNDRNPAPLTIEFLQFIRSRLKQSAESEVKKFYSEQ